jgi:hypothetical protein
VAASQKLRLDAFNESHRREYDEVDRKFDSKCVLLNEEENKR